jgi:hypothetical protein
MAMDVVIDVLLQLGKFPIQAGDDVLNGGQDAFRRGRDQGFFPAVMFTAQVLGKRFTARQ